MIIKALNNSFIFSYAFILNPISSQRSLYHAAVRTCICTVFRSQYFRNMAATILVLDKNKHRFTIFSQK